VASSKVEARQRRMLCRHEARRPEARRNEAPPEEKDTSMTEWQPEATNWEPDEQQLHMLHDAVRRLDRAAYLDTLLNTSVVMPADPDSDEWAIASLESGTWVVVFSSIDALRAIPSGADQHHKVWPVIDLLHAWPHPDWALLIDGSLPTEVSLKPATIAELVESAVGAYPLDAALSAAGDLQSYLDALQTAEVVVPMRPAGSPSRDLANPDFAWWRTGSEESEPEITLFSSPVRLQVSLGDVPWLIVPFSDLLPHWPNRCAALIDPQHDISRRVSADVMSALANTRAIEY